MSVLEGAIKVWNYFFGFFSFSYAYWETANFWTYLCCVVSRESWL